MTLAFEHGTSRSSRWLHRHRLRTALWVAVAEGVLIVIGIVPKWPAFFAAVALIAFYAVAGRRLGGDTLRQVAWIAAASQLLIAGLPALVAVLTFAAIVFVAILILVALALLFLGRR